MSALRTRGELQRRIDRWLLTWRAQVWISSDWSFVSRGIFEHWGYGPGEPLRRRNP